MDQLLSLARMARAAGVPQTWLREQADAGKVPHLKAGKRYLFVPAVVQEALAVMASRPAKGANHAE